jgi:hypothetical protein
MLPATVLSFGRRRGARRALDTVLLRVGKRTNLAKPAFPPPRRRSTTRTTSGAPLHLLDTLSLAYSQPAH